MDLIMIQLMYDLNKTEALRRIPVILVFAVLSIFGIASNLHVWFIYKCYFKSSTYRVFVLFMAMIDIVCCFVTIPFEIVDELFPFAYTELISCKIFSFLGTCISVASVFMLVVIAFERYGKVCNPDGYLMSETSATFWSTIVLIASVMVTFPAIYVYGRKTITRFTEVGFNVNGTINQTSVALYDCSYGDNIEETLYFRFYYVWILMIIIGCMIALIVLYGLILATLGRNVMITRRYSVCNTRSGSITPGENNDDEAELKNKNLQPGNLDPLSDYTNTNNCIKPAAEITTPTHRNDCDTDGIFHTKVESNKQNGDDSLALHIDIDKDLTKNSNRFNEMSNDLAKCFNDYHDTANNHDAREILRYATTMNERELPVTKITFALSVLYLACCLPHIVCVIAYLSNARYAVATSTPEYVFYLIGSRLYLVYNVLKAVIYGCMDRHFRTNFVKVYRSVFNRCKTFVSRNPK